MPADPPPHPGPRPDDYEFPFALAEEAKARTQALIDEMSALRDTHNDAYDTATDGFQGEAASAFADSFDSSMCRVRQYITYLRYELDDLEEAIRRAHDQQEARDAAIAGWQTAKSRYDDYLASQVQLTR